MSKYTSQLRYICESKSGFTPEELEEKSIDEIIAAARPGIFDFDFPIHSETFRPTLENEILFHFYMNEIGMETYGQWHYYLMRKLREIMPYYSQLYASAELEFNPFHDVDYTKTHGGVLTGDKQTTGNVQQQSESDGNTTDQSETETSGAGTATGTHSDSREKNTTAREVTDTTGENDNTTTANGTTGSRREKNTTGREVTDTTSENNGSGTLAKTGSKQISNTYSESNISRDAYSDTPQTSVLGVEGDGSGNPTNNVSDNYYLTNYRKITQSKSGQNSGSESTTDNEQTSTHNEGVGNSTTNRTGNEVETITGTTSDNTVNHGETVGNSTTNKTGNEAETSTGTTGENTTSSGHSETTGSGTSHDETSATTDSTGTEIYRNTDDYTDRIFGKMGTASYSALLKEYRETLLNINKMVFDDLECLFMQIY